MPASISAPATSNWPFISASTSAVWLSGSISLMLAPEDASTFTQSTHPARAASSRAVKPPGGSHLSRGSAVRCRSQVTTVERTLTSAPASTSTRTIAACPCAAAHISGVWPRQLSPALTFAPRASSAFAASTLPVCAQV